MKSQREIFLKHVAQTSDLPFSGFDMNVAEAAGSILIDVNGKKFTDLISGISVSNIGHCHPKVIQAIEQQSKRFMHLMVYGEFNQSPQTKYAQRLTALLPEKLNCVFYTTGGSEAVEGAMKLAKRVTGRHKIISFKNAYHGSTQGALSLMGDEFFKNSFRPLLPGIELIDYNDITAIERIDETVAAVFAEPVQGEAGVIKGSDVFLKALRKKCDDTKTLLIFDEIQSGFGRTGKLFAFEHSNVIPDVLLIAKGMGGGLPIGAFIASNSLMSSLTQDPVLGHINTFGGNAVCVEAARATLDVILDEGLMSKALNIESLVRHELSGPGIKEIRMFGALGAVDMGEEELNFKVIRKCIESGVVTDWFLFCSTAFRIAPPLNIPESELVEALRKIKKVIAEV